MGDGAVAYLVNDNVAFQAMALVSAITVRKWNKEIEILLLTTGGWHIPVPSELAPFAVREISPIFGDFPFDKCAIGAVVEWKKLIYLDADTFVLDDIAPLFDRSKQDISARLAWVYEQRSKWDRNAAQNWRICAEYFSVPCGPILNSGLIVFRDFAHVKVLQDWKLNVKALRSGVCPHVYGSERHLEQLGFALAIQQNSLGIELLNQKHHGYGWVPDSKDCTVYHLSSRRYASLAGKIAATCFQDMKDDIMALLSRL